ncbi:glutaminyl-tRNA synthetase [Rhizodiscina lignyota]|uniref:glutamine--tRNA ligase n=1 Tax=Rhizodiscina lignyota TaxID=1504668 RepID=A0A9P4IKA7_9PEZI|nr:glutaminyl-tRNA synthetase [Rhizodiscina lignyota]
MAEAPKEISKRAAEKAKKKLEKAAKKQEYASRPKPDAASTPSNANPSSMFDEGWLKRVYEEKPVKEVRTRFPPEPNGYLHIGHAKAIAVNFGFAKHYNGICFLRFDDTNPEKEEEAYFTSIREIVAWLGFKPHQITHSSDHFDRLYELAEELIRRDKAYVCHCTKEEVNLQRGGPDNRGKRFGCAHRDRPIEESITEFRNMRDGKYAAGEAHLRMKQSLTDPNEGNPQMWDLAAYRVTKNKEHARTGNKWKIYPTYDFTHCLCDSFEDISHSLCTTEFFLSRTSYDWLLEVLDIKKPKSDEKGPMQREYGRLNVAGTILSKRRIQQLVQGHSVKDPNDPEKTIKTIPPAVRGWDDPRLFTLVALRRRGIPAPALLSFVSELGVTDALTNIQIVRFEAAIRKYLERTVPRLMLVLDPILVVIEDLPEDYEEVLTVPFDPKKPDGDSRKVPISRKIYIDRADFREEDDPNFFRLAPGKTVGLLNAPFLIKATSFEKDENGKVTTIKATKVPTEAEKPKAFIHWVDGASGIDVVARQYNTLFLSDEPNTLDWKEGGYADNFNPNSEVSYKEAKVEKALGDLMSKHKEHGMDKEKASDDLVRFQAVRTAYFCVDLEKEDGKVVLNQIVTLKEDKAK